MTIYLGLSTGLVRKGFRLGGSTFITWEKKQNYVNHDKQYLPWILSHVHVHV